jgi:hypothetical protein
MARTAPPETRRNNRWAKPAGRCVGAGSARAGKPGNEFGPWAPVERRGNRVSPVHHRGGGWDSEPVTASARVGRVASELCGSESDGDVSRGVRGLACQLIVWRRAIPKNRMSASFTSGSVGRLGTKASGFTRTPERRIGAESGWRVTWPPPGDACSFIRTDRRRWPPRCLRAVDFTVG